MFTVSGIECDPEGETEMGRERERERGGGGKLIKKGKEQEYRT